MKPTPDEPRKYIEAANAQAAKKPGGICGDYIVEERTAEATTVIVADGIGTDIKARVAAVMCASRLMELIRVGFTLREACHKVVDTMHAARTMDIPFSAFSVCRVLVSGHATVVSYEIPSPILINNRLAAYLPKQRVFPMGLEMVGEVNCMLEYGDGIIMVSDGVSQAGLGQQYRMGWGVQGACDYINGLLAQGMRLKDIPGRIVANVRDISGATYGDDTTCSLLLCREARAINILTGPPARKMDDARVVKEFMEMKGTKIVCGSSTAEIVARNLGVPIEMKNMSNAYHKPPSYDIKGVDYATEGAITLNQVYNILGEAPEKLEPDSSVSDLYRFFHASDTINFLVGTAANPGHEHIVFRQMGVYPRDVIVRLLAEKLKSMGKLVNIIYL
ncbi:MAG TPA: SpoIIE family protein phosphatase [Syntrophorhabdaceae bacterium]|nr:SpoIIE family protein phosphatase [Syntrophorhabdaceae bacterium]